MARRSAAKHAEEHDSTNVAVSRNFDDSAPTSTLAAQIVQNQADGAQQHASSKATFGQLLDEIRACPENVEADTPTNVQLIKVVADAGLDALSRDDPFARTGDVLSQAIACLDVICIAIDRDPDVLFYVPEQSGPDDSPMAFWLVPKLLTIVDNDENDLQTQVRRLLGFMTGVLSQNPVLWEQHAIFKSLLKACVNGLFQILGIGFLH